MVSYLVEEVEDAAREVPRGTGGLTVEEVHDDDDPDPNLTPTPTQAPTQKTSGLLSRLFSRTKTNQDVTGCEPPRRTERGELGGEGAPAEGRVGNPARQTGATGVPTRQARRLPLPAAATSVCVCVCAYTLDFCVTGAGKRGKTDARDRLLHVHRAKPRQPKVVSIASGRRYVQTCPP